MSGGDAVSVLKFLAKFKDARSLNRVLESVVVYCFQLCVETREESFLSTRATKSSMAVDSKQSDRLQTYGDVVSCLLHGFATDGVIEGAYNDVGGCRQSSGTMEGTSPRMQRKKTLRL